MYNESEDEIWESFLKATVIENSLNETKDYPSEKEINSIILLERYDWRMRKTIEHYRYRKNAEVPLRYGRKIALIVFLIMGISFTALLSSEEVRTACQNVIIHIYEKYIQLDFASTDLDTIGNLECIYLPDGYYLFESTKNEYRLRIICKNDSGDIIELLVYLQDSTTYIDNEHYIVSDIHINGIQGKFFESTDTNFKNCITWHIEQGGFRLSASLEKGIMIRIAEDIK